MESPIRKVQRSKEKITAATALSQSYEFDFSKDGPMVELDGMLAGGDASGDDDNDDSMSSGSRQQAKGRYRPGGRR